MQSMFDLQGMHRGRTQHTSSTCCLLELHQRGGQCWPVLQLLVREARQDSCRLQPRNRHLEASISLGWLHVALTLGAVMQAVVYSLVCCMAHGEQESVPCSCWLGSFCIISAI